LKDRNADVRHSAIRNPNVTKEHIDKTLNDSSWYVRETAKERSK